MPDTLSQPPIDYAALVALREIMAEGFAPLVAEFQQQLHSGLERITTAANKSDYNPIKACAHQLRGSALDMTCSALAQALANVESCANAASSPQLQRAIEELQVQMLLALEALNSQL